MHRYILRLAIAIIVVVGGIVFIAMPATGATPQLYASVVPTNTATGASVTDTVGMTLPVAISGSGSVVVQFSGQTVSSGEVWSFGIPGDQSGQTSTSETSSSATINFSNGIASGSSVVVVVKNLTNSAATGSYTDTVSVYQGTTLEEQGTTAVNLTAANDYAPYAASSSLVISGQLSPTLVVDPYSHNTDTAPYTISVDTSANNYTVGVESTPLTSGTATIPMWAGTNAAPTAWGAGAGFGYTLSGSNAPPQFSNGTLWAGFTSSPATILSEVNTPYATVQQTIRTTADWSILDGIYTSTISYVLSPTFSQSAYSEASSNGTPNTIVLSASLNPIQVTQNTTISGSVLNSDGLPVADGTWVTLSVPSGTLSTSGVATSNGNFQSVYTCPTVSGVYTITVSTGGVNNTIPITCNPGPPASVSLVMTSGSFTAGGSDTATVTVKDAYGNLVLNGTSVSFSTTSPAGSFSPNPQTTTSGQAIATYTDTKAGTWTLTATAGGINGTASETVVAGPTAKITITPTTSNVAAGGSESLSACTSDQYGNINNSTAKITFTISAGSPTSSKGTPTGGCYSVTWTAPTTVQTVSVSATDGTYVGNATIYVVAGPVSSITVAGPSTVNTSSSNSYTATATDSYGNDVSGLSISWSAPSGSFSPTSCTTNASGYCSSSWTSPASSGSVTLTAASGAVSGTESVTVQANTPTITWSAPSSVAGGSTNAVSVTVSYGGSGLSGYTINWSLSGCSSYDSLSATSSTTNSSGIASVNYTANYATSSSCSIVATFPAQGSYNSTSSQKTITVVLWTISASNSSSNTSPWTLSGTLTEPSGGPSLGSQTLTFGGISTTMHPTPSPSPSTCTLTPVAGSGVQCSTTMTSNKTGTGSFTVTWTAPSGESIVGNGTF